MLRDGDAERREERGILSPEDKHRDTQNDHEGRQGTDETRYWTKPLGTALAAASAISALGCLGFVFRAARLRRARHDPSRFVERSGIGVNFHRGHDVTRLLIVSARHDRSDGSSEFRRTHGLFFWRGSHQPDRAHLVVAPFKTGICWPNSLNLDCRRCVGDGDARTVAALCRAEPKDISIDHDDYRDDHRTYMVHEMDVDPDSHIQDWATYRMDAGKNLLRAIALFPRDFHSSYLARHSLGTAQALFDIVTADEMRGCMRRAAMAAGAACLFGAPIALGAL